MFCRYLRDVLCLRRRRVLGLRGKICIDDGRQDAMLVLSVSQRLANSNYVVSFVKDFFGIVFAMLGVCACGSCGSERQCADESTEFFGNLLGDLVHGRGKLFLGHATKIRISYISDHGNLPIGFTIKH